MTAGTHGPRALTRSFYSLEEAAPLVDLPIGAVLELAAARFGPKAALVDGVLGAGLASRWTFDELAADSRRVARALLTLFSPGDRVAIWAANSPEWLLVEFGAALAGLVLVTVNPAYRGQELVRVMRQSAARGILVQDSFRGRSLLDIANEVAADLPDLETVVPLSIWDAFLATGDTTRSLPVVSPDSIAQIQYTSGTTGAPKGACLTHRGLANNGRLYALAIGATADDVWINPMPMFHTAGCGLVALGALQTGGVHVIPHTFGAADMLDLFERERGTIMLSVPTMLIRIIEQARNRPRRPSTWRLVTLGGAPVSVELIERARSELGLEVGVGYGQTEASPYLTHTRAGEEHPDWQTTVGRPLPWTEVKIVDPATGAILPIGVSGEICGRGYGVMAGYFRDEEASRGALDDERWLHTGDIGSMDSEGYIRIDGRLREMIIRGGENVYPREVEDVLSTHPAVANVAVFGMPDREWGEIVAACVVLRKDCHATSQELIAFCSERLASFKRPSRYRFLEGFPETASGKTQKFALRELLLGEDAAA